MISPVFATDPANFRVITPDVGGGFGMKAMFYAEQALTCYAARKLGRPVKWASDRGEAFLSDIHGRDNLTEAELAIDADGRFVALRTRNVANMGAYLSTYAPYIPTYAGTSVLASVYGFKAIYANVLGVFTNTVPVDAYRGAGRPESNYLVERLVDAAARELNIDRVELRRRNMVPPSAMPYSTPVGKLYDSGDFRVVLDAAIAKMDYAGFAARRSAAASRGKRRGFGLAYYLEATGGDPTERAEIRFAEDGFVDVYVGTQSTGQGHETAYVQLTVEPVGHRRRQDPRPPGRHRHHPGRRRHRWRPQPVFRGAGDPDHRRQRHRQGQAGGRRGTGSRGADIGFADGRFSIVGTDRGIDIVALATAQRMKAAAGQPATLLDAAEVATIDAHTFPNGCHIAEVEVDPETGTVELVRYVVCDDVGKTVNPLIVLGQVAGGVAQGFGQAVLEHTVYDPSSGQLLSGSLMDYALPRANEFPDIEVELLEVPCASNPLGVKGAGEAGAVGSPPAVINAIIDALSADGVTHIDMPATPERVWRAMVSAKAA